MVSRSHAIVNGHFTGVSKVSLDCEGYRLTPFDLESVEITKETREVERHGAYIYTIKYSLHRLGGQYRQREYLRTEITSYPYPNCKIIHKDFSRAQEPWSEKSGILAIHCLEVKNNTRQTPNKQGIACGVKLIYSFHGL